MNHTLRLSTGAVTKEFISKAPSPSPSPFRGEGNIVSLPLRGGNEGEGDVCGLTNDRVSKKKVIVPVN